MIVVRAFVETDVERNRCSTWQWLCWTELFNTITVERKRRCNHCWVSKRLMSHLAWFGNTVFEIDVCW